MFKLLTNDGEIITVRDKTAKIIARGDNLELHVGDRCYFDIQEITVEEKAKSSE